MMLLQQLPIYAVPVTPSMLVVQHAIKHTAILAQLDSIPKILEDQALA